MNTLHNREDLTRRSQLKLALFDIIDSSYNGEFTNTILKHNHLSKTSQQQRREKEEERGRRERRGVKGEEGEEEEERRKIAESICIPYIISGLTIPPSIHRPTVVLHIIIHSLILT